MTTLTAHAAPSKHHPKMTPLTITSSSLPAGTAGSAYTATVATSGGTAPVTLSATGLPAGLSMSSSGVVSGTPTAAGTSSVTVKASDSRGTTATKTLSLVVAAPAQTTPPTSGSGSTTSTCTNPVYTTTDPNATWAASHDQYGNNQGPLVNQDVWGASGSNWSQELDVCSPTSWNVLANFQNNGGAIQTYPDTQYVLGGKTVSQYNSMQTCFGEQHPTGGEWDYGYDVWSDNWNVEIMVWNDWTDTGIYPPSNARAVTIDGVAYHEWKGGGSNEWIYTRDDHATSGCFDMLGIYKDLIAHEPTSGLTANSVPGAIEYGVEIAGTNGPEKFSITNASLATS